MAAPQVAPKQHRDIALAASLTAAEDALEDIGHLREWLAAWGADTFLTGKVNAMIVDAQYVRDMLGTMSGEPTPQELESVASKGITADNVYESMKPVDSGPLPNPDDYTDPEPPFKFR